MSKGQKRSNRELKKPKKEVPKVIAAAPSAFTGALGKPAKGNPKSKKG